MSALLSVAVECDVVYLWCVIMMFVCDVVYLWCVIMMFVCDHDVCGV